MRIKPQTKRKLQFFFYLLLGKGREILESDPMMTRPRPNLDTLLVLFHFLRPNSALHFHYPRQHRGLGICNISCISPRDEVRALFEFRTKRPVSARKERWPIILSSFRSDNIGALWGRFQNSFASSDTQRTNRTPKQKKSDVLDRTPCKIFASGAPRQHHDSATWRFHSLVITKLSRKWTHSLNSSEYLAFQAPRWQIYEISYDKQSVEQLSVFFIHQERL